MSQPSTSADLKTDMYNAGSATSTGLKGLSLTTKKRLGISAAALLLGGGAALAFMRKDPNELVPDSVADPAKPAEPFQLPPNAEVAHSVNDSMSFETAFEAARDEVGLGGVFVWHNQPFNTFLKEEWTGLSLQQRQEYAEHVLDAKLPIHVQPLVSPADPVFPGLESAGESAQATVLEGAIGDRRVMGVDLDNDGIIDSLLIEGEDGYTYRVVDAAGDEGLDTIYVYDAIKDDYVLAAKLDQPFVLTNDAFNQELEQSMSREAVDTLMAEPTAEELPADSTVDEPADDDDDDAPTDAEVQEAHAMLSDVSSEDSLHDTYVNDANVDDMHHPAQ